MANTSARFFEVSLVDTFYLENHSCIFSALSNCFSFLFNRLIEDPLSRRVSIGNEEQVFVLRNTALLQLAVELAVLPLVVLAITLCKCVP